MMNSRDFSYYLFLIIILSAGVSLIYFLSPDSGLQMSAAVMLSLLYAVYGITHHFLQHNLVAKIVIEYILIAGLGIAISLFIFRGGFGF